MAKKPVSPEKIFVEQCKTYLSSMTARACQYGYLNVAPNRIIITNSTSVPSDHGDRLMNFNIGELGLHFVYFKDPEFLIKLRTLLQIPTTGCYVILINNFIALLNKYKFESLETYINPKGYHVMTSKGATEVSGKNTVAFPIHNFHIERNLFQFWDDIKDVGSEAHQREYPHHSFDLNLDTHITNRVYFFDFDLIDFKTIDGKSITDKSQPMRLMAIDGITNASIQEFVKKISNDPYTLRAYLWCVNTRYVLSVIEFDNAVTHIRSLRPNLLALTLPGSTPIETRSSLTTVLENTDEQSDEPEFDDQ